MWTFVVLPQTLNEVGKFKMCVITGMTPAEMQALWKEVQQAQAAQAGHPPLPIPGVEDIPKSVANGIPTPPAAASQLPIPGAVPNGVPDNFLMPRKSHAANTGITQKVFITIYPCKWN